ncbi:MAG: hypothetical protein ABI478_11770 [Propionivibrio sp.]
MDHETIRRRLAQRAGVGADSPAIAEAALGAWGQIADALVPVIGTRGVDALFSRSLHVTARVFPWLAIETGEAGGSVLLGIIKARLAANEPLEAAATNQALLVNFTALLSSLIGESLSESLLEAVWISPAAEDQQEHN